MELLPPNPGVALDVGAGMGITSCALAAAGWRVVAAEPDPGDLVGAGAIRALAAQAGLEMEVLEVAGEELPTADCTFDLVFCRQTLHHARNLERLCREAHRVLRPGGLLVATREHVVSSTRQLRQFLAAHPLHSIYGGEHAYTLAAYRNALLRAGFTALRAIGPLESVMNYAPLTESGLIDDVARRAARIPAGGEIARLLLRSRFRKQVLKVLSRCDRKPGRLYSFVATRALLEES
jgi:SAM-dependent methyltransferase